MERARQGILGISRFQAESYDNALPVMITIKDRIETSFAEKKSKFIGLAVRVTTEQQALMELEHRKKQHYDATHNCYAYLLENGAMRYSDDGEPQGTAGIPMLEVLKRSGLSDVLFICTRYFGGILLGAGGLVRAYTKSAADTLHAAQKLKLITCGVYKCVFPYGVWAKAESVLRDLGYILLDITFTDVVGAAGCVAAGSEAAFIEHIKNLSQGKTIPEPAGQKLIEVPI
jgi:uncharacterized YigZ family protein